MYGGEKHGFRKLERLLLCGLCEKAMPGLNSRNQYRDCIVYLKKLSTYPEGLDMARKIAQEWRETYRNRRAMRDELSKAGF